MKAWVFCKDAVADLYGKYEVKNRAYVDGVMKPLI